MLPDEEPSPEDILRQLSLSWRNTKEGIRRINIELAHCEEIMELIEEQNIMKRQGDNGQACRHPGRA